MIVIQISPGGVQEIAVQSPSLTDEDQCLALWPLVREELGRLDARLRREGPAILDRLHPDSGGRVA
jgi:hypothetical protein